MKVLITNDDGVQAPGILALARRFSKEAEVIVVAPEREKSATGHAITMHKPLRARRVSELEGDIKGKVYSINGTPSDCVKLGLQALINGEEPDLVISGVNRGANLGTDVLYSGTVSGAMEGLILGYPSLAVSVVDFDVKDYTLATDYAVYIAKKLHDGSLSNETLKKILLNINVPNLPEEKINGMEITHLGVRRYEDAFEKRIDPRGREYYWMAGDIVDDTSEKNADVTCVSENKVSVTPIKYDITNYDLLEKLRGEIF
ncbi:5'/3'-nucleotidase SurE [Natranaerofaba carboxydovora]|uniref:5'/3'-nucleotidase SurE n=1 Tax=Natranaerofaba carboxydovora TaxID=2742683 RepID=UPI001F144AD3|nr:5'/3'-nucleotidase SurE [Natranaerofaba carboxydovora]UMZ73577.1 5'-nucleotidase SurE [Natranaerofaba carboxydovora]